MTAYNSYNCIAYCAVACMHSIHYHSSISDHCDVQVAVNTLL